MSNFKQILELEILTETKLLKQSQETLAEAPPGRLFVRERKKRKSYYQIIKKKAGSRWRNIQLNINEDTELIRKLTEKRIAEEMIQTCLGNLKVLENTLHCFRSCDTPDILASLPSKYQDAFLLCHKQQINAWFSAPYQKAPFDAKRHIHITACGELVRSKSEVIIADALFSCGIPFHYEERFPYPDDDGNFYYPDFTILLPNGLKLIWEHLGLLGEMAYCVHNAQKLHNYQRNKVFIGKT